MKPQTIKVGGYAPKESVHSRAVDHFAAELKTLTNGEIETEILYNVLDDGRPATALFDLLDSGEIAWCYYSSSYLGKKVPELNALEVPFLFATVEEAHAGLDAELGTALADAVHAKAGYEVLGFWDNGLRHLTNAVRPIHQPTDCRGLRIRLQPNAIHEALAASWEMQPVTAELSAGIAMIKEGKVDAQENPLANTIAYGVEHQHITLSAHLYGARGLFANPTVLAAFGEAGDSIREAARRAIAFQRTGAAAYEIELRQAMEAEGRHVVDLAPDQRTAFMEAASEVIADARGSVDTALQRLLP